MNYFIPRGFWYGLYLFIIVGPLFALLAGASPPGRGLWWEFSSALGFMSITAMGMEFALTARFKRATAPFGIDIVYYFHKYVGLVVCGLVVVHPAIMFLTNPSAIALLDPVTTPLRFKAGIISALAIISLSAVTFVRRRFNVEYDNWRLWHRVLAVVAILAAIGHVAGVGYSTQEPWKRTFWAALGLAWAWLVLYMWIVRPILVRRRPYVVEAVREEHGDNWTIRIRPKGHGGIRFLPGQFAWLSIWHSPFEMRDHPFSIASSAEQTSALEFTIKERGDFTRKIKTLSAGEIVYVDGPYGSFSCDRYLAAALVFIAGGIGAAPIMSMLRTLADRADRRPLLLFYANKRWERAAFREELDLLRERLDLRVVHIVENPAPGWQGDSGFINAAMIARHLPDVRGRQYFICGPVPMMNVCEKDLRRLGVPVAKFHSELFNIV
jgi:predicted ferric reductase